MKRSLLLIVPFVIAALASSCNKEGGALNTVTPGGYTSLGDHFAATALQPVTQSIKVSSGGEIISTGGAHILFPKNAFQTYSGTIVTGSVDVKVNDWIKKGDMVFGRVLPVSNNEALSTSGQAYVEVTQKGVPVRLRKGFLMEVRFPQFNVFSTNDSLYLGQKVAGAVNTVNWYARDTSGGSYPAGDTVILTSDSLRYIASSHFLLPTEYKNFTLKLNTPVPLEQSVAVALIDGVRSVYPVASAINGSIYAQRMPNMPMHIAVMGVNKGVFYAGIADIPNPQNDSSWQVTIKEVAPQAFRLQMNALP